MIYKNEKQLLNIIKFTPPIFIITISIIITFLLSLDKQNELEKEKISIKNKYIKENKELIMNDVENLYDFILKTQAKTEERLKENIKNRVYEAQTIVMTIYNENKDKKSKDEIKTMIKDALVNIRFNEGRGYFFIYSFDYECILLPINRKLEGSSFYNFQDYKGKYLTRDIITQLKKEKEGFQNWYYAKPNDLTTDYKKIGFNIYFEPYDWFIGTGEYVIDYENTVKAEVLEYISRLVPNKENYFFVLDYNKKTLFHVIDDLINKPAHNVPNVENNHVFDEMLSIAKEGSSFLTYNYKPNDKLLTKTSYIKGLQNWGWIIGKGFYHDNINVIIKNNTNELNKKFHTKVLNIISIAIILTIILLIISIYISKLLEKKFTNYKKEIDNYIDKNTEQQHILSQQSKMAAMGEMLGNIAHQWRQPLSVITTVATGMKLQKEFDSLDDVTFEKSIDNITNSALYLSDTIEDFRNFFRTDKEETVFYIENVFEKVFKLTNAQFKNHEIIFIKNINDFKLFGFENEFIQALINILNNAKDALETIDNPRLIFISTYEENNKAIIKITDNAGGIDEEIIDKICEPYFTTKHQAKGTGIGLYMTEEIIVKHMNGTLVFKNVDIIYENQSYKGAEITIKLAFKQQEEATKL
ncbi:MAG: cache domain-containing protein [Aliarcobacter sp.]|nr:cache domain-containing protein [Aliarcobacter sp.]